MGNVSIETIKKIERTLNVCGDATRLKILFSLVDDNKCTCGNSANCHCSRCGVMTCMIERCVSEIIESTGCSQSLVSHQLKVLRELDLVKTRKDGLRVYYSLKDGHIKELLNIMKEHVEE
ncbi:MAG: metalloregulator ArsR/SmtB family transcription factor [Bacilli bacterium]|nr:metalloregulator ArsR/SmtB family transcription factor [Bacilli bacterium]